VPPTSIGGPITGISCHRPTVSAKLWFVAHKRPITIASKNLIRMVFNSATHASHPSATSFSNNVITATRSVTTFIVGNVEAAVSATPAPNAAGVAPVATFAGTTNRAIAVASSVVTVLQNLTTSVGGSLAAVTGLTNAAPSATGGAVLGALATATKLTATAPAVVGSARTLAAVTSANRTAHGATAATGAGTPGLR